MAEQVLGFPLSPQQKRLWLLGATAPRFGCRMSLQVAGALSKEFLRRILGEIGARHGILRTTFYRRPGLKLPIQVIADRFTPFWQEIDLTELDPVAREERIAELWERQKTRPFQLAEGPLWNLCLIRLAPRRHVLLLALPALASDARTLRNLLGEIVDGYSALAAGRPPAGEAVQYIEVAQWHNGLGQEEGAEEGRRYWRREEARQAELGDTDEPTRGAAPRDAGEEEGFRTGLVPVAIADGELGRIEELAERYGVSVASVLFTAWQILTRRLSGRSGAIVARVFDGRRYEELHDGFGLFASALPIASCLAADRRFSEVARELDRRSAEAYEQQEYFLLSKRLAERDNGRFELGFEFDTWPRQMRGGGLSWTPEQLDICCEPFRLALSCQRQGDQLSVALTFDLTIFAESTAVAMAGQFGTLLRRVLAEPEAKLSRLPILGSAEFHRLILELNDTDWAYPREKCFHQLFAEQAARTPHAAAAEFEDRMLSYGELDIRANRLAHTLCRAGVGPDQVVAICILDPLEMTVALMAILKAGGAYLPLDPTYPRERLAFMLADAEVLLLVSEARLVATLPRIGGRTLLVDAERAAIASESGCDPSPRIGSQNLAYVLYTSGSTGRPKGVMVPHRGLTNYLSWCTDAYQVAAGVGVPVSSPIGFDLTVTALFSPLLVGRRVLFTRVEQGIEDLCMVLRRDSGFSLIKLTPSHLELLHRFLPVGAVAGAARALVIGGEALMAQQLSFWRAHAPRTRLINEYGPTETVVGCCVGEVDTDSASESVPIGRPIANTRIYLLDDELQLVAAGVPGEIHVGGPGPARGYLGRPALSAARFVPDPLSRVPGARLYRTGDLARLLPDGRLVFIERRDRQVAVRGFRIELGEIESVLAQHPGVAAVAVVVREDRPGEKRLVAYLVPAGESAPSLQDLLSSVRAKLPEFMIPSNIIALDELPLTHHGKLDREALPAPDKFRPRIEVEYVAPRTQVERQIATVWREVLQLEEVGIHDNFFDLGGHSFLVFLAQSRLSEAFDREIPVVHFFRYPTLHSLAESLSQEGEKQPSFEESRRRAKSRRTSMRQQRQRRMR